MRICPRVLLHNSRSTNQLLIRYLALCVQAFPFQSPPPNLCIPLHFKVFVSHSLLTYISDPFLYQLFPSEPSIYKLLTQSLLSQTTHSYNRKSVDIPSLSSNPGMKHEIFFSSFLTYLSLHIFALGFYDMASFPLILPLFLLLELCSDTK
jgi:hypothetical protein